jgi:SAM-dependent methyltransferase
MVRRVRERFGPSSLRSAIAAWMGGGIRRAQLKEIGRLRTARGARKLGAKDAFSRLVNWLPPPTDNTTVLELGCGPGKYAALLGSLGYQVVGVDPFSFPEWELVRQNPNITLFDNVYAENLPFPDQTFDHIVCLGALLYFNSPVRALDEMRRVLKPHGRLVLRTINRLNYFTRRTGQPVDPASKNLYDINQLTALLWQAGFSVNQHYSFGFLPPFGTNLYWYAQSVWFPYFMQDLMSWACPANARWIHVVLATPAPCDELQTVAAGAGGTRFRTPSLPANSRQ